MSDQVYAGPLEDGGRAVVLFNRHIFSTWVPCCLCLLYRLVYRLHVQKNVNWPDVECISAACHVQSGIPSYADNVSVQLHCGKACNALCHEDPPELHVLTACCAVQAISVEQHHSDLGTAWICS